MQLFKFQYILKLAILIFWLFQTIGISKIFLKDKRYRRWRIYNSCTARGTVDPKRGSELPRSSKNREFGEGKNKSKLTWTLIFIFIHRVRNTRFRFSGIFWDAPGNLFMSSYLGHGRNKKITAYCISTIIKYKRKSDKIYILR